MNKQDKKILHFLNIVTDECSFCGMLHSKEHFNYVGDLIICDQCFEKVK